MVDDVLVISVLNMMVMTVAVTPTMSASVTTIPAVTTMPAVTAMATTRSIAMLRLWHGDRRRINVNGQQHLVRNNRHESISIEVEKKVRSYEYYRRLRNTILASTYEQENSANHFTSRYATYVGRERSLSRMGI